jgi:ubiquitin C-terminal hydrolase
LLNNKTNYLININNEYKEKYYQLEKKIKEYEIEKEGINESNDEDNLKIYGFINSGNNCYLNSSLQLLTRIKEFKKGVLTCQDNIEINKDNDTKGKLFFEIKKIINEIENSDDDNLIIDPQCLKYVMGNIDAKYFRNFQEDANEFISNFISGLYKETATKARVKDVKKLEIDNETEQKAYDNFYRRYYVKKGNSFLTEIFYGIQKTRNYCKNCGETITNNFCSYNMLELPIYKLVKKNKNKTLDLNQILNEYRAEKKIEFACPYCKDNSKIYTETLLYTLPKYLMLSFIRTIDNEYIDNNIIYNKTLEIKNDYDNKNHKYLLKCVIEHSGGAHYGHYTALCPKDKKSNIWYRFSDSTCYQNNNDFHSRDALILLYKNF